MSKNIQQESQICGSTWPMNKLKQHPSEGHETNFWGSGGGAFAQNSWHHTCESLKMHELIMHMRSLKMADCTESHTMPEAVYFYNTYHGNCTRA